MTIHNQKNNNQKNENNIDKSIDAEVNTAITNPEPALAAAAQAEQEKIEGNQPHSEAVPNAAKDGIAYSPYCRDKWASGE